MFFSKYPFGIPSPRFFAVLSGFQPWDIPGVGTFYDFIDRLWNYATPNFSPHCKPPVKKKVKKPKEKGAVSAPTIPVTAGRMAISTATVIDTSQPDCSVGWDSSRECWYFGYDLYLLTDADSELPLFPLYHAASNVR